MYRLTDRGKETVQGLVERYVSKHEAIRKTYSKKFNLHGPHIYTLIVMSEQTIPWSYTDLTILQEKGPHWEKPGRNLEGVAVYFDAELAIEQLVSRGLIEDISNEDFELCEKCNKYHLAGHPCKT